MDDLELHFAVCHYWNSVSFQFEARQRRTANADSKAGLINCLTAHWSV